MPASLCAPSRWPRDFTPGTRTAANLDDTTALWEIVRLREQAGDQDGADRAAREAAPHGDTTALRKLGRLRKQAGNHDSATALYRQAARHGDDTALWELAWFSEKNGGHHGADTAAREASALQALAWIDRRTGDTTIRRFRLTDNGHPATSLTT